MRAGSVAVAYHEPRFIQPHLRHLPDWVDEKIVLLSTKPWQGVPEPGFDRTGQLAELNGAYVIPFEWKTEHEQRNAGQDWLHDVDWIITLDPDEFLTKSDWDALYEFLETAKGDAYVCQKQVTYWKEGYKIDPPEDYKQIIAVKPSVRFTDKRCVDAAWGLAPVTLHHLSWARTDQEVRRKLAHYSHANEINSEKWLRDVWTRWTPDMRNLHPLTPSSYAKAVPTELPEELKGFGL